MAEAEPDGEAASLARAPGPPELAELGDELLAGKGSEERGTAASSGSCGRRAEVQERWRSGGAGEVGAAAQLDGDKAAEGRGQEVKETAQQRDDGAWPAARLGCSSDEGLEAAGKDGAGPFCWAARRRREPRCGGGGARRRARQRQPQEAEAGGGAGVEAGRREGHRGWPTRGLRGIRRNRSRGLATEEKDEWIGSKQQEGEMAALRGGRGDGTRARLGVRGDRAGLTGRLGQA